MLCYWMYPRVRVPLNQLTSRKTGVCQAEGVLPLPRPPLQAKLGISSPSSLIHTRFTVTSLSFAGSPTLFQSLWQVTKRFRLKQTTSNMGADPGAGSGRKRKQSEMQARAIDANSGPKTPSKEAKPAATSGIPSEKRLRKYVCCFTTLPLTARTRHPSADPRERNSM